MERLKEDGAFAQALKRRRDYLNTLFAYFRRLNPGLEAEEFSGHLCRNMNPVVEAVGKDAPERLDEVVEELFKLSLELFALNCLGRNSHCPAMEKAWQELFPAIPRYLAQACREVGSALCNAVINLSAENHVDVEAWLLRMKALANQCGSREEFLDLGKVLAWRFGMAHYRDGALEVWPTLPDELFYTALDLDGIKNKPSRNYLLKAFNYPWFNVHKIGQDKWTLSIVGIIGGFRGFGGDFINPPWVVADDNMLFVYDEDRCRALFADSFGAVLKQCGEKPPRQPDGMHPLASIDKSGRVKWDDLEGYFPELQGYSSAAAARNIMAVTMPLSHLVYLIAPI